VLGTQGLLRIAADTEFAADVRSCRRLEVYGVLEGDVMADDTVVHEGGRLSGRLRTNSLEVRGVIEGNVIVRNLITIRKTGTVNGDVHYGRMMLEPGGELTAKVKNVPPELIGDFSVSVRRGQHVVVTTQDIDAVDPDNTADELIYTASNVRGGHIALDGDGATAVTTFTQADLNQRRVLFVHNGGPERSCRFDVVVHDIEGASSGRPRSVDVTVVA
jgi:cytoskeletal protein CcmA (bactofilin family)